jgi:hypothetical protein
MCLEYLPALKPVGIALLSSRHQKFAPSALPFYCSIFYSATAVLVDQPILELVHHFPAS